MVHWRQKRMLLRLIAISRLLWGVTFQSQVCLHNEVTNGNMWYKQAILPTSHFVQIIIWIFLPFLLIFINCYPNPNSHYRRSTELREKVNGRIPYRKEEYVHWYWYFPYLPTANSLNLTSANHQFFIWNFSITDLIWLTIRSRN